MNDFHVFQIIIKRQDAIRSNHLAEHTFRRDYRVDIPHYRNNREDKLWDKTLSSFDRNIFANIHSHNENRFHFRHIFRL